MNSKTCKQCGNPIVLNETAKNIITQMKVIEPVLCNLCSMEQLMSFRNERTFYSSKCQKCNKPIVGMYPSDTKYAVWCRDCWWKGDWDATEFGLEYQGPGKFFEQMKELQLKVPREGLVSKNAENSEYSNHIRDSKDCYMCSLVADQCEDDYYSYWIVRVRNSADSYFGIGDERTYSCITTHNSYGCSYLVQADNCTDCHYCYDVRNCSNCMFSSGLRNKSYVFRNKQLTKEAYEKEISKLDLGSSKERKKYLDEFVATRNNAIHKFSYQINSQDCSGENILNSTDVNLSYNIFDAENVYNAVSPMTSKNIVNAFSVGTQPTEWVYNSSVSKGGTNIVGGFNNLFSSGIFFCENLVSCNDCIGSIGLNKKDNCILNKQYSKEEYEKIKAELLAYWNKNGQLGEPLPKELSCFAYNETAAQDYHPKTKEEATKHGFAWKDKLPGTHGKETIKAEKIADNIKDVDEKICDEVLACTNCGRNYKVIKPELALYKKLIVPIPRECWDCRLSRNLKIMGEHKLYDRACTCTLSGHDHKDHCGNKFLTIYKEGEAPEKVFCESCYQKEVA